MSQRFKRKIHAHYAAFSYSNCGCTLTPNSLTIMLFVCDPALAAILGEPNLFTPTLLMKPMLYRRRCVTIALPYAAMSHTKWNWMLLTVGGSYLMNHLLIPWKEARKYINKIDRLNGAVLQSNRVFSKEKFRKVLIASKECWGKQNCCCRRDKFVSPYPRYLCWSSIRSRR